MKKHYPACMLVALFILLACTNHSYAQATRLLRNPAISQDYISFAYAGDIWIAKQDGSEVRRLTTFPGVESAPHFSPDGTQIAFSASYEGNTDVYTISTSGGKPIRLTWHPETDLVKGWTPDGTKVLFASGRTRVPIPIPDQFWTVSLKEGIPEPFIVPRVTEGQYSPDGKKFVYQMIFPWDGEWRNYRGGQDNPIRIIDLETLEEVKLPWEGSNDKNPTWINNEIFFLSDRDFAMNVWSYNTQSKQVQQVTFFKDFDCKNLSAGDGKLIFENGGYLYLLKADGGEPQKLSIEVEGDFSWARPQWVDVKDDITDVAISPTGKRAVFSARGEIFTIPAKKGDIRTLTHSSGTADRAPAWSPDGQSISWFSDESGEYQLIIADQYGEIQKQISLKNPTFYYTPVWSPDSKYTSFGDAGRNLWLVEVSSGTATLIDNEGFANPIRTIYPEWAPDSQWIAYTKRLSNEYNVIFVYSLDQKKTFQLTDGMSDSEAPAWDKSGKYLYLLASTNFGLNVAWLDMSSINRPLDRAVYAVVLPKDEPSPLAPESDEEKKEEEKPDNEKKKGKKDKQETEDTLQVKIDFEGINQRIIALNIPERSYTRLSAGDAGTIFYTEQIPNQEGLTLHKYSFKDREAEKVFDKVSDYKLTADGSHLLYALQGGTWGIRNLKGNPQPDEEKLDLDNLKAEINPPDEWKQVFREAWRFQRDYFYVKNVHGLDLDWAYTTYAPWVNDVRHRSDLTYILDILGGETSIGHSFTGGGAYPHIENVPVGLLGADYKIIDHRYQLAKIYIGENWNPDLRAPLSAPGINVKEGEYLLAVNGQELNDSMNVYSLFDQTADKQTILTINNQPTLEGARTVTVVPVSNESALRQRDWMENNRRKVDELSDGKLAYVWLPNTAEAGYTNFNRYYFAQKDKKGAIIDERFNGGGYAADYIIDLLSRELIGYFSNPVGNKQPFTSPDAGLWGPKVMLINEMAGSGGDYLPYMFKQKKIGTLVGTRTWGGLVGIWDVPQLIDGGYITAPRGGFFNLKGEWDVENKGITPDLEVEQDPKLISQGHDPQLEKAVQVALDHLKTEEVKLQPQPPDPVRVKRPEQ